MWGQVKSGKYMTTANRIIPTRVGTRRLVKNSAFSKQDHPHACGDKAPTVTARNTQLGSSPRVWGQACLFANGLSFGRIIPTRVGTSLLLSQRRQECRDHPHACGDKLPLLVRHRLFAGSSPRVWGQAHGDYDEKLMAGIIPTRVGTSLLSLSRCL